MPIPSREETITPFMKYLQDTMRADAGAGGMFNELAPLCDAVYVNRPVAEPGAPPPADRYVLITAPTDLRDDYVFHRAASQSTQQVDIFTRETTTNAQCMAIYRRMLYLFDGKMPVIPGLVAVRRVTVEMVSVFDENGRTHGLVMFSHSFRGA